MNEYRKGKYIVKVEEQRFAEGKGAKQFVLRVKVLRGVDAHYQEHDVEPGWRNIFLNLNLPKPGKDIGAIHVSHDQLRSVFPEWDGQWSKLDPNVPGFLDLTGKELPAFCEGKRNPADKYDQWVLPRVSKGGGGPKRESVQGAGATLDALFAAVNQQSHTATPAPQPTSEAQPTELEESPF